MLWKPQKRNCESSASANSATSALLIINYLQLYGPLRFSLCIPFLYSVTFGCERNQKHQKRAVAEAGPALSQRWSVALIPKSSAPFAIRQQRQLLCPNKNKGQGHSRKSENGRLDDRQATADRFPEEASGSPQPPSTARFFGCG